MTSILTQRNNPFFSTGKPEVPPEFVKFFYAAIKPVLKDTERTSTPITLEAVIKSIRKKFSQKSLDAKRAEEERKEQDQKKKSKKRQSSGEPDSASKKTKPAPGKYSTHNLSDLYDCH
jgi:hypothetical protein